MKLNIQSVVTRVRNILRKVYASVAPEIRSVRGAISGRSVAHISFFLEAVREKKAVIVRVKGECEGERDFLFHPYALEHDRHRWFVFGLREGDDKHILLDMESVITVLFSRKKFRPFQCTPWPSSSHSKVEQHADC